MADGEHKHGPIRMVDEPGDDRLTQIAAEMLKAGEALEGDGPQVKFVVMLQDGESGGIAISGYEDDGDAITDVLIHLETMLEVNGQKMIVLMGGEVVG